MDDLNKLLLIGENTSTEFKRSSDSLPNSFWETYSAFANTNGGVIVLGITENDGTFDITGVKDADKIIKDLWSTLENKNLVSENILTDDDVRTEEIDGRTVIIVDIPEADRSLKPIFIKNNPETGTYVRIGEGDHHCKKDRLAEMYRDSQDVPNDLMILRRFDLTSINIESLHRYRAEFNAHNMNNVLRDLPDEQFLEKIGAADKDETGTHPTKAGLLMFGSGLDIVREYPSFFLDYHSYDSSDVDWSDRISTLDIGRTENVFDFYVHVMKEVLKSLPSPFTLDKDMRRVDDTPLHRAVREILTNALLHSDYQSPCAVTIDRRPDSIKVINPGHFRIPVERAERGGLSNPRNPTLFRMFGMIGAIERAGTGIYRAISDLDRMSYPRMSIEEYEDPSRVEIIISLKKRLILLEDRIAAEMTDDPSISIDDLIIKLGVPKSQIVKSINEMKSEGRLTRVGRTKGGHWVVMK